MTVTARDDIGLVSVSLVKVQSFMFKNKRTENNFQATSGSHHIGVRGRVRLQPGLNIIKRRQTGAEWRVVGWFDQQSSITFISLYLSPLEDDGPDITGLRSSWRSVFYREGTVR